MAITSVSNKTGNKREQEPIRQRGSPRNEHAKSNYFPKPFQKPFPFPILILFLQPFPSVPRPFLRPFLNPIPRPFLRPLLSLIPIIQIAAHCFKKAGFGIGVEAVSEHLSSRYLAHVDLSISSHICNKIVLGRNVCNCRWVADSDLDARDLCEWKGEHVMDSHSANLV